MNTAARTAAPMLIAALLLGAGHTLPAAAGSATKTYTDSARGISFRYPATWKALLHRQNTGYTATIAKMSTIFIAPDSSVALLEMVGDRKLTGAALQSMGLKLYKDGQTVSGPITIGQATIGKVSFSSWSGNVKGGGGSVVLQTVYAGTGSARTYYIGTVILVHPAASAKAVRAILDSVAIR